jgi:hypothetical protein
VPSKTGSRRSPSPTRLARDRKRIAFDRLLARLVATAPGDWVLKGGFAMDLRLSDRARTTKDVDLAWHADEDTLADALLDAAAADLGDYFVVSLERTDAQPDLLGGAHRFHVTVSLAGRPFESFLLDVGTHDGPVTGCETLTTPDLLGFAGVAGQRRSLAVGGFGAGAYDRAREERRRDVSFYRVLK